jgi:hypothetical protein
MAYLPSVAGGAGADLLAQCKSDRQFYSRWHNQNGIQISAIKRVHKDFEVQSWLQYERWKAPVYKTGLQSNTGIAVQITWFPDFKK